VTRFCSSSEVKARPQDQRAGSKRGTDAGETLSQEGIVHAAKQRFPDSRDRSWAFLEHERMSGFQMERQATRTKARGTCDRTAGWCTFVPFTNVREVVGRDRGVKVGSGSKGADASLGASMYPLSSRRMMQHLVVRGRLELVEARALLGYGFAPLCCVFGVVWWGRHLHQRAPSCWRRCDATVLCCAQRHPRPPNCHVWGGC
jgi:hypothetical protein